MIADCTEAIRIDPSYFDAYNWRGESFLGTEEYDKAIGDFTEAIRLRPTRSDAYIGRGYGFLGTEDYDKAIGDFTEAIRLDPKNSYAYTCKGDIFRKKKEYAKAIAYFTEVVRIDPKDSNAYVCAAVLGRLGQVDKAIKDYNRSILLDPKLPPLFITGGTRGWYRNGTIKQSLFYRGNSTGSCRRIRLQRPRNCFECPR